MQFSSPWYYLFLALTTVIVLVCRPQYRVYLLLLASFIFYLSFDPRYIIFILGTTAVSFYAALVMQHSPRPWVRNLALTLALTVGLGLLAFTKYWNALATETMWFQPLQILVPLGISFYTFQIVGYLLDVYRRQIAAEARLSHYALFVSFFPQLLAGPIERAQTFLPQIGQALISRKNISIGIFLILIGLFKKLVIADRLAPLVNLVFENPEAYQGSAIGLATFCARLQIYADFSAYTDIALGSAQILGFHLTENFRRPFLSKSISEYWQRWHISLAQWIRTYIFFPLVSTPLARGGVPTLIIITFLVLGLWHGGTINFLIYGLCQGLLVVLDVKTRNERQLLYHALGLSRYPRLLNTLAAGFTFFILVIPPTLFFRSPDFSSSKLLLSQVFQSSGYLEDLTFLTQSHFLTTGLVIAVLAIFCLEIASFYQEKYSLRERIWEWSPVALWFCMGALMIAVLTLGYFEGDGRFIYMAF